jgi:hypothetical protein
MILGVLTSKAVTATLFLDLYPNAVQALSLRKLRSAYTGSCIRVRRSNDNNEIDIGFTSSGVVDATAILTFVGNANTGYIAKWYDQSGYGNDVANVNTGQQAYICNAGVMQILNGKYSSLFSRTGPYSNYYTAANWSTADMNQNSAVIAVYQLGDNTTETAPIWSYPYYGYNKGNIYESFGANKMYTIIRNAANTTWIYSPSATTYTQTQALSFSTITSNVTMQTWLNNVSYLGPTTITGGAITGTGATMTLSYTPSSASTAMYFQELVSYGTNQISNRTGMQNNINSYYSIY